MNGRKIGADKEEMLVSSLFYFLAAPLPSLFLAYELSDFIYQVTVWLTEVARDVSESSFDRMRYAGFAMELIRARNIYLRIYPFAGFGLVVAAILLMRTAVRNNLVWKQKISCAVRANCVAIATLLSMSATGFINPASEKFTEQMLNGGMPIFWSQILVALGMFLLTQRFFLRTVETSQPEFEKESRGLERSESREEEEVFIPKPKQAG